MSAEEKVEKYYERKGYDVVNLEPGIVNHPHFAEDDVRDLLTPKVLSKGVPDLFVYRKSTHQAEPRRYENKEPEKQEYIEEKFFVEVKSKNGGIRYSQFKWIDDNPEFDCLVAFVTEDDIEIFPLSTKTSIKSMRNQTISNRIG